MKIIQPLIFSIYPIVFLSARYPSEKNDFLLYFMSSILFGLVVIGFNYYLYRQKESNKELLTNRTITISYIIILLFFSFGHGFNGLYQDLFDIQLSRGLELSDKELILLTQGLMVFFWLVLLITAYKLVSSMRLDKLKTVNSILLVFSMILLALPLISLSRHMLADKKPQVVQEDVPFTGLPANCEYCDHDVYYIILDGYARNDILENFYDFNNAEFSQALEHLGFDIIEDADANYFWTNLSLGSSLNMNYLDKIGIELGKSGRDLTELTPYIRNNLVSRLFKSMGYQYIHMDSTWEPTRENPYADIEYACDTETLRNDFHKVFVEGTLLRLLNTKISEGLAQCHLNNFRWLSKEAPKIPGRKFVFAHFISPHPPYLFDSEGNVQKFVTISDQFGIQSDIWGNRKAYLEQLKFVNTMVLEAVTNIIQQSKKQPIIIIQSDHGPHLDDENDRQDKKNYSYGRKSIFLAILTPDQRQNIPVKTPVNLFRYIFTNYFDSNYELLEDKVFSSTFGSPLILKEVK